MEIIKHEDGCWTVKRWRHIARMDRLRRRLYSTKGYNYSLWPTCYNPGCINPDHLVEYHPKKKSPEQRLYMLDGYPGEGCWSFTGSKTAGYGLIICQGRNFRAHRYFYEHFAGSIPEGLVLDHLCGNKACCNPKHLEPVTLAENSRRGSLTPRKSQRWYQRRGGHKRCFKYPTQHYVI